MGSEVTTCGSFDLPDRRQPTVAVLGEDTLRPLEEEEDRAARTTTTATAGCGETRPHDSKKEAVAVVDPVPPRVEVMFLHVPNSSSSASEGTTGSRTVHHLHRDVCVPLSKRIAERVGYTTPSTTAVCVSSRCVVDNSCRCCFSMFDSDAGQFVPLRDMDQLQGDDQREEGTEEGVTTTTPTDLMMGDKRNRIEGGGGGLVPQRTGDDGRKKKEIVAVRIRPNFLYGLEPAPSSSSNHGEDVVVSGGGGGGSRVNSASMTNSRCFVDPTYHHTNSGGGGGLLLRQPSQFVVLSAEDRQESLVPTSFVRVERTMSNQVVETVVAAPSHIRIFLIRHAESEGNVNNGIYHSIPDHAIPLTKRGRAMARRAGAFLKHYFEKEHGGKRENLYHHVRMWVSPFRRTRETAEEILKIVNGHAPSESSSDEDAAEEQTPANDGRGEQVNNTNAVRSTKKGNDASRDGSCNDATQRAPSSSQQRHKGALHSPCTVGNRPVFHRNGNVWIDSVRETAFLAEQDFGVSEGDGRVAKEKYVEELARMKKFRDFSGQFWARFPQGESYFDVCVRLAGIFTDITNGFSIPSPMREPIRTVIIVSHGVTIRAFLSTWCRYSPEWLAESRNPPNCSIQVLQNYHDEGYIFGGFESSLSSLRRGYGEAVQQQSQGKHANSSNAELHHKEPHRQISTERVTAVNTVKEPTANLLPSSSTSKELLPNVQKRKKKPWRDPEHVDQTLRDVPLGELPRLRDPRRLYWEERL